MVPQPARTRELARLVARLDRSCVLFGRDIRVQREILGWGVSFRGWRAAREHREQRSGRGRMRRGAPRRLARTRPQRGPGARRGLNAAPGPDAASQR